MNTAKIIQNQQEVFGITTRDEPNSGIGGANNDTNDSVKDLKSFDYKTSISGKLECNNIEKEVEIVKPLNI